MTNKEEVDPLIYVPDFIKKQYGLKTKKEEKKGNSKND